MHTCIHIYTHTYTCINARGEKGGRRMKKRPPPKHLASILLLVAPLRRNSFLFLSWTIPWTGSMGTTFATLTQSGVSFLSERASNCIYLPWKNLFHETFEIGISRLGVSSGGTFL